MGKRSPEVQKRCSELVKSGMTPARAMEKASAEELEKGVLGTPGVKAPTASAMGTRDRTQANPGNPGAKMTIASAFGGDAPKAPAAQKSEAVLRRVDELVKSGWRPGDAIEEARKEAKK